MIKNKNSFVTILKNSAGNWDRGASVHIFERNGKKYLKTVADETEKDNLGDLPGF